MPGDFLGVCEFRAQSTFFVRGNSACNDQADPTACPFCEKLSHADVTILLFLKTGMHRSHDRTVLDCRFSDLKRRKQVGILGCRNGHRDLRGSLALLANAGICRFVSEGEVTGCLVGSTSFFPRTWDQIWGDFCLPLGNAGLLVSSAGS